MPGLLFKIWIFPVGNWNSSGENISEVRSGDLTLTKRIPPLPVSSTPEGWENCTEGLFPRLGGCGVWADTLFGDLAVLFEDLTRSKGS